MPNSLVQNIASHADTSNVNKLPNLLDDSFLLDKLEQLRVTINGASNESTPMQSNYITLSTEQSSVISERYSKYTNYIDQLDSNIECYKVVLKETQTISDGLVQVVNKFDGISVSTNSFIESTNKLYKDFIEVTQLHEAIPKFLQYFESLDPIMRRLNHASSANIVRKDSFKTLLSNIEQSLQFLEEHPDFKEVGTYRIKFKQCLIRSCELIANYLNNNLLRYTATDVVERIKKLNNSDSTGSRDALLYNKFSTISEEYFLQVSNIIARVENSSLKRYQDELNSILNNCFEQYFQTRIKLLSPVIKLRLIEINKNDEHYSLVKFIQDGKSYFHQLCIDEYRLFVQFFPENHCKYKGNQWLVNLCEPFYDECTSRLLRETDISVLCDSVVIFSQYYEFEEGSEEYVRQFREVQFDKIFQPILQRLQQRLILRVQQYVEKNIIKYTPTIDSFIITKRKNSANNKTLDIENDTVLKAYIGSFDNKDMIKLTRMLIGDERESIQLEEQFELDVLQSYYPPLIKALAILSKIFEMVNSVVFDDMAHHIVHDCIFSLKRAYNVVLATATDSGSTKLDMDLAYLKNLLLLHQQIQIFNIEYTVKETYLDFSAVEGFFSSIRNGYKLKKGESSVLEFARDLVPKVVNNMVDAKFELMLELRNIIKNFTEVASKDIIHDTFIILPEKESKNLIEKTVELRNNIEDRLPRIHTQILNFINDEKIVTHLMEAIQEVIVQSYSQFFDMINERAEAGEFPKEQISELMYVDIFANFIDNITRKLVVSDEIPLTV